MKANYKVNLTEGVIELLTSDGNTAGITVTTDSSGEVISFNHVNFSYPKTFSKVSFCEKFADENSLVVSSGDGIVSVQCYKDDSVINRFSIDITISDSTF